ncbi:hypothetical protein L6R53_11260 [Myxococcota bacterium]|nr:hypothetical protein [Myxococcota bacterium]
MSQDRAPRRTPLGRRLVHAAVKPLHLLPPGLGVVTAGGLLVAGLPPLALAVGALSLGTWGALVAWDLATPPPPPPPPSDPLAGIRSAGLRARVEGVRAAARRVQQRLATQDSAMASALVELEAEAAELWDAALQAALRGDAVEQLLGQVDQEGLSQAAAERAAAARRADDPEVARALEQAAQARQRELDTWRELEALAGRIHAELVAAEAALDELHARLVRVMLDEPGEASAGGAQVRQQVHELAERLQILERSAARTLQEVR